MDGLQVSTDSDKFLHSRVDHDKQHYANSPGAGTAAGNTHEHTKANPGGLKPLTFGLLVAAVTCIVTAGLVGGIVGGVLGNRTSKSPSNSSSSCTPTTVVSTATVSASGSASTSAPTNSGAVYNNYIPASHSDVNTTAFTVCPLQDGQNITTPRLNEIYNLHCYVNLGGQDIVSIVAYSLEDCIQACTNTNNGGPVQCVAVNFWAEMSAEFTTNGGNCWLKQQWENGSQDELPLHVGAVLVG